MSDDMVEQIDDPKEDDMDKEENVSSEECETQSVGKTDDEKINTDEIGEIGELDYEEERSNDEPDDDQKTDTNADSDKETKDKEDDTIEEGEDEGEITEEDDLEEGEVKEDCSPSKNTESARQICRFYGRGHCYYGSACRFVHLTGEKGQYNMFAPRYPTINYGYPPSNLMGPTNKMMNDRPPRVDYMPPMPVQVEPSAVESAWERGLREAKELVKKANKRKVEEPDFNHKKLNLSLCVPNTNERTSPEFDKENYSRSATFTKRNDTSYKKSISYEEPVFYDDARSARENFRGGIRGRYENLEIHYTRMDDMQRERDRERPRARVSPQNEKERYTPKENRNKDRKDDRSMFHNVQMRTRAFDYVDPWRRERSKKTDVHRQKSSRSRSGSYSSVSSYSYSDRSSRSSGSYSRSTSGSSSRSPSVQQHKRKASPSADAGLSPKPGVNRFSIKKNPTTRLVTARNARGRSYSRSHSSRSRSRNRNARNRSYSRSHSSRSRSRNRSPPSTSRSRSRSRSSYSRSISMDSVSSDSSVSHSSSASESRRNRNAHVSLLRKKTDEKLPLEKLDSRNLASTYDREESSVREPSSKLGDLYQTEVADVPPPFPSFQHLLPVNDKAKSQHKQQIKLTLLNKPALSKSCFPPKKELDRSKLLSDSKNDSSKADVPGYSASGKRPLSPTLSALSAKPNPLLPKKSASSRRDELLKQLKAVEDAIARKRAKFC